MTRRVGLIISLLVLVAACQRPAPPPARTAILIFSQDANGELSPCACQAMPPGGLARRVALIQSLKTANPGKVLAVEAGGSLFRHRPTTPEQVAAETARARVTAAAYRRAGYDAVFFAAADYALGLPLLRELGGTIDAPVVGSNVRDAGTDVGPWLSEVVLRAGGLRIGLIGIVNPNSAETPGARFIDPAEIVEPAAKRMRPTMDAIVLLTDLSNDALDDLLGEVRDIDLVIKTGGAKPMPNRVQIEHGVPIVAVYEDGRFLGRIDLTVVAPGKRFVDLEEKRVLERKIERYQASVDELESEAGGAGNVESRFADDAEKLRHYRDYKDLLGTWRDALAELDQTKNHFAYSLIVLNGDLPEDEPTRQAVRGWETIYGTPEDTPPARLGEPDAAPPATE